MCVWGVCLQHGEVMAWFGLQPECYVLVVSGHQFVQEALGFFGQALAPAAQAPPPLVGLLAVPPQPQLPHDAFEHLLHVVLHHRRRLNELAVEHHSACPSLCGARRGRDMHWAFQSKHTGETTEQVLVNGQDFVSEPIKIFFKNAFTAQCNILKQWIKNAIYITVLNVFCWNRSLLKQFSCDHFFIRNTHVQLNV